MVGRTRPELAFASDGATCLFCGGSDRPVAVAASEDAVPEFGACEACAVDLYWHWHSLEGEGVPIESADGGLPRATCVRVYLPRLGKVSGGKERLPPDAAESYEHVAAESAGEMDLPGDDVAEGESAEVAALRALGDLGITSWPPHLVPLYAADTPRGRHCVVFLATAWTYTAYLADPARPVSPPSADRRSFQWRRWPAWEHAPSMAGLYAALRYVWPARLAQHLLSDARAAAVSVELRQAAATYLRLRAAERKGDDADLSMLEVLRRSISDAELAVARKLGAESEAEADLAAQEASKDSRPESPAPGIAPEETGVLDAEFEDVPETVDSEGPDEA